MSDPQVPDISQIRLSPADCHSPTYNLTHVTLNHCLLVTSPTFRQLLPATGLILGVMGVVLNSLVAGFFRRKQDVIMPLIYLALASSDMISCFVAIFQALSVIMTEYGLPGTRLYFYTTFFIVGQLSFHVSAFINVLLTVARTTSIFFPLHVLRRKYIISSIILYTLLWAVLITAEWLIGYVVIGFLKDFGPVLGALYVYPRPGGAVVDEAIFRLAGPVDYETYTTLVRVLVMLTAVFIPYGLPSLICLVCAVVQVKQIVLNASKQTLEKSQERNRKMSITIILLTVVFFSCNTTYLIAVLLDMTIELDDHQDYRRQFVLLVASNHLLYLNSALTPLILILRGSTIKTYVLTKLCGGVKFATRLSRETRVSRASPESLNNCIKGSGTRV